MVELLTVGDRSEPNTVWICMCCGRGQNTDFRLENNVTKCIEIECAIWPLGLMKKKAYGGQ